MLYLAVVAAKSPSRIRDLLGYQTLIIQVSMEYKGDGWLGYDHRFWQNVTADPITEWRTWTLHSGTLLLQVKVALPAVRTASARLTLPLSVNGPLQHPSLLQCWSPPHIL